MSFLLLLSCQKEEKKEYEKIQIVQTSDLKTLQTEPFFTIPDSTNTLDFGNKLVLKHLENKTLYIKNVSNDGYISKKIECIINSDLNIIKADYSYSDDTEDGSKDYFTVDKLTLKLNKNPFTEGIENLEGEFNASITLIHYPYEFYKFPRKLKTNFSGRFKS